MTKRVTYWLGTGLDPARFVSDFRADLRSGVRAFAIDLSGAGHLHDRFLEAIRDVWIAIQEDQREGPRAKLTITNASVAHAASLRAANLSYCIPVECRP